MTRRNTYSPAQLIAFLLACSLLIAQWTGLQHRVAHAHLQAGIAHDGVDIADKDVPDKNLFHSCVLLDASTIGTCLPSAEYVPPLLSNTPLPIVVPPLVSWQALFTRQFSSRAPPFLS